MASLQKAFINTLEPYGFILRWMNALFWASKSKVLFTPLIKLGRAWIFFNITLIR